MDEPRLRAPLEGRAVKYLAIALLLGCGTPHRVPMAWRPDTRMVWGVHLDSLAMDETMSILRAALPHEAGVCYTGTLRDTAFVRPERGDTVQAALLSITGAVPALQDSADDYHVYGVHCATPSIAVGHSHPYAVSCDHSRPDALALFANRAALVSLAWCGDGNVSLLYQDGRREVGRWRP